MYAVFETGGKQYRVAKGDTIKVERLDAEDGAAIEFDKVLLLSDGAEKITLGTPYVAGGKVIAKVKSIGRGEKLRIIKFKRRKQYLKQAGHRQAYTEIEITKISGK